MSDADFDKLGGYVTAFVASLYVLGIITVMLLAGMLVALPFWLLWMLCIGPIGPWAFWAMGTTFALTGFNAFLD
jgi:hypothetical protein